MSPRGQRGSKQVTEEIQQRIAAYQTATKAETPVLPSGPGSSSPKAATPHDDPSPPQKKKRNKEAESGARKSIPSGQSAKVGGGHKAKEDTTNKKPKQTNDVSYGATGEPVAGVVTSNLVKERRANFQNGTEDQPLLKVVIMPHGDVASKSESCRCILS